MKEVVTTLFVEQAKPGPLPRQSNPVENKTSLIAAAYSGGPPPLHLGLSPSPYDCTEREEK